MELQSGAAVSPSRSLSTFPLEMNPFSNGRLFPKHQHTGGVSFKEEGPASLLSRLVLTNQRFILDRGILNGC